MELVTCCRHSLSACGNVSGYTCGAAASWPGTSAGTLPSTPRQTLHQNPTLQTRLLPAWHLTSSYYLRSFQQSEMTAVTESPAKVAAGVV